MNNAHFGWSRATRCNIDQCVEVSVRPGTTLMRDSKSGDQSAVLTFSADSWRDFIDDAKAGLFDVGGR
ncbi:DUF397 domain-containing protein [Asanoa siamensis]|uniref:DUF397 domain-containing protein n=1 Tax=Asanoa siamensis TaxID=926357 RepID=A0ABQ4CJR7_9ACTN|nr:hypothetical protein Asi02nite_10520 [Asanoa siamensis]